MNFGFSRFNRIANSTIKPQLDLITQCTISLGAAIWHSEGRKRESIIACHQRLHMSCDKLEGTELSVEMEPFSSAHTIDMEEKRFSSNRTPDVLSRTRAEVAKI